MNKIIESGNIGRASSEYNTPGFVKHNFYPSNNNAEFIFDNTNTIYFRGTGATKGISPGGFDGRNEYMPESAPWSEYVKKNAVKLIVEEGITYIGEFILDNLPNVQEIYLADSVIAIATNQAKNVKKIILGKGFKANHGDFPNLEEIDFPDNTIFMGHYCCYGNVEGGFKSSVPETRNKILAKEKESFLFYTMSLFRNFPSVYKHMESLFDFSESFCYSSTKQLLNFKGERWLQKGFDITHFYLLTEDLENCYNVVDIKNGMVTMSFPSPRNTISLNFGGLCIMPKLLALAAVIEMSHQAETKRICINDYFYLKELNEWLAKEFPNIVFEL